MATSSSPRYPTGEIRYIEIPAIDVSESALFYQHVLGWNIRQRNDRSTAFDDTVHAVSGTWVLDRPPSDKPGVVGIMVANAAATIAAIVSAGGEIVQAINHDEQEMYARFRYPVGNILSISNQVWRRSNHSGLCAPLK